MMNFVYLATLIKNNKRFTITIDPTNHKHLDDAVDYVTNQHGFKGTPIRTDTDNVYLLLFYDNNGTFLGGISINKADLIEAWS